ncbi:hypothetical protein [Mesorhizobium sp. M4B.F.Ca.ET.058.02.1.1]|uniref:hypothetical protein n=1 Tax=Mesorhizobium sp. M4B.F.Ca.ET.058.02.1.1 TaxID=2493675 RepID=UPI00167E0B36|nr:hypothetical protein [Mesorhizobium sp. M4B.F.Ca.ET.058.02.1.1]
MVIENFLEEIRQTRSLMKVSLQEAKRIVVKRHILKSIEEARNFYELRALVRTIAEKVL